MEIKSRNRFRLTRFVFLRIPILFKFLSPMRRAGQKKLLIIKLDAIGDYILFRNFIEAVKSSEKYSGFQIDLLGNTLWQTITTSYDAAYLENCYFVNPTNLLERPLLGLRLGWKLFKANYDVVLHPTYSRVLAADGLVGLTAAKKTIGFKSDNELLREKYKKITDKFYTDKILLPQSITFEFERNRYFFSVCLDQHISICSPNLHPSPIGARKDIIIFPGSGYAKRNWNLSNFSELINTLLKKTDHNIILSGGPSDYTLGLEIMRINPNSRLKNTIGTTSLPEMIQLISNSLLVIANETSAIHIAASCQTKVICIMGGGHYNRFAPYPLNYPHQPVCVYEQLPCFSCSWKCKFETGKNDPYPCISLVRPEKVWEEISPLITIP